MAKTSGSGTVREWVSALASLHRDVTDADRVELLRSLEELKAAAAAAQARATVDFDRSQRVEQESIGEPASRLGRGVAEQIALARRESPVRADGISVSRRRWSRRCRTPWPR